MSAYTGGRLLSDGDVLDAVYDYLLTFARPTLESGNIIRGWENRMHLPADSQDYAVITAIGSQRVGTNVTEDMFGAEGYEEDEERISVLRRIDVQIDFCSLDHKSHQRAASIEAVSRDDVGVSFFRDRGLSCLYGDKITSVDYQDGTKQQVHRNILELHLSGWFRITVTVPHATSIVPRLEDVDAFHPPIDRGD